MKRNQQSSIKPSTRFEIKTKLPKNISKELEKKRESVLSELPFRNLIIISIVINIMLLVAVFLLQKYLPPEIPIYYGLPESSEQLASSITLVLPAALSLSIIIINSTIAVLIKEEFLKKALIIATFTATFFSTIAIIKIALLVGSF